MRKRIRPGKVISRWICNLLETGSREGEGSGTERGKVELKTIELEKVKLEKVELFLPSTVYHACFHWEEIRLRERKKDRVGTARDEGVEERRSNTTLFDHALSDWMACLL